MTTEKSTRVFESGTETTLSVTVPSQVVTDSQPPFNPDDDVTHTDDDRLIVTSTAGTEQG